MTDPIRLHPVAVSDGSPSRLVPFAGRALGEQAFTDLQDYADARLAPLLRGAGAGILRGLEVGFTGTGSATRLRIDAGLALAADGTLVGLALPMQLDWADLVELYQRTAGQPPGDGFHYLTLARGVEESDAGPPVAPCPRTEPDPLRDLRVDTVAVPGLRVLSRHVGWMQMDAVRAGNRLAVHQLRHDPFAADSGAVPLAVIKVRDGVPEWIDSRLGRIEAAADGVHRAFLAHTRAVMSAFAEGRLTAPPASTGSSPALSATSPALASSIASTLQPDAASLSAAAPSSVSAALLGRARGIAAQPMLNPLRARPLAAIRAASSAEAAPETSLDPLDPLHNPGLRDDGGDPGAQTLPARLGLDYLPAAGPFPAALIDDIGGPGIALGFAPGDLQVEIAPTPASVIPATVERELPRGLVDLVHHQHERIRVLIAIADADYRPDLLDLPQMDRALIADLYQRGAAAFNADTDWRGQWQALFNGLDDEGRSRAQAPALPSPPPLAPQVMDGLVAAREDALGDSAAELPEPYHTREGADCSASEPDNPTCPPPDYAPPSFEGSAEDGLYRQRDDLRAQIQALEDELEENFDLLEALNGYLTLQRQQLDSLSISFTTLAGGTPGDGSGLSLMRWSSFSRLEPLSSGTDNG